MSQFSRTDYLWLADAWAKLIDAEDLATDREVLISAAERFGKLLAAESPSFDKGRFLFNIYESQKLT